MPSATLKFIHYDALNKDYSENLGYVDSAKVIENAFNSDTAVRQAFLENINSACRSISTLTTNIYKDSYLAVALDVNEEIMGGD